MRVEAGLHRLAFNHVSGTGTEDRTLTKRGKGGEVGASGGKAGNVERRAAKGETQENVNRALSEQKLLNWRFEKCLHLLA